MRVYGRPTASKEEHLNRRVSLAGRCIFGSDLLDSVFLKWNITDIYVTVILNINIQGILQEAIPLFNSKCENGNTSGEYILNKSTVTTETNKVSVQRYLYLTKEIIEL